MIIDNAVEEIVAEANKYYAGLTGPGGKGSLKDRCGLTEGFLSSIDHARLDKARARLLTFTLPSRDRAAAIRTDWTARGELRGLISVLRRVVIGNVPFERALNEFDAAACAVPARDAATDGARQLLEAVMALPIEEPGTIAKALKMAEKARRAAFGRLVRSDVSARDALAKKLGLGPTQMTQQLADLLRRSAQLPCGLGASANNETAINSRAE